MARYTLLSEVPEVSEIQQEPRYSIIDERIEEEPMPQQFSLPRYLGEKAAQGAMAIADLPALIGEHAGMQLQEPSLNENGELVMKPREIPLKKRPSRALIDFLKGHGVNLESQHPTTSGQRILGKGAEFIGASLIPGAGIVGKGASGVQKAKQLGKLSGMSGSMGITSGGLTELGVPEPISDIASLAVPAGAATTVGIKKLIPSKSFKKILGNKELVAEDIMQGLPTAEIPEMIESQEAGRRLGLTLTPAEASRNPLLGKTEGKLGVSPKNEQALYEFKKGQKGAQKEAIEKFKSEISPSERVVNDEVREASKNIIDKRMKSLQKKAEPYYQKSETDTISRNKFNSIMKDSNIQSSYKKVLSDPTYESSLEKLPKNSVKVLDQVKKNMQDRIDNLYSQGKKEKARLIVNARKKLVNALDEVSPDYKKARSIYSEDLPAIQKIENSKVGKIANMSDDQIKNVTKTIFDPNETDIRTFVKLRNDIMEENPEIWRNLVKNEIDRRMSSSKHLASTESHGSEFYNQILARQKDYMKFYSALGDPKHKGVTPEQQKLADMRKAFKGLINSRTVKTAAGQSETKMTQTGRGSLTGTMIDFYNKWVKGKYDKAAIEIITDPDWKKYLPKEISKSIKGDAPRNPYELISALVAIDSLNKDESEGEE